MSFRDSAKRAVLDAARALELKAGRIGIVRSVDATEAARWLKETAQQLRVACTAPASDEPSLPEGLRQAADLIDQWSIKPDGNEEKMAEAFSEICAAHDALLASLRGREVYSGVVRERDEQLEMIEQVKRMRKSSNDG